MQRVAAATIAGSDPSGGAGLQTDLRVFTLLGVYAQGVITALTVQNSLGVKGWQPVEGKLVRAQIEALFEDLPPAAVKTGMLANAEIILAVAGALADKDVQLVVDPVMVAKGGARLLEEEALKALREKLLPLATVITPNIPEAEALVGERIEDPEKVLPKLKALGPEKVILKGGHLAGEDAVDLLYDGEDMVALKAPRVRGPVGHGTGCTFSAALTAGLAQGISFFEAAQIAKKFVTLSLKAASLSPLG
ncbi:MAG TPA: bifunctional hydroxymethylpyrimidine kinase/phosphomethylpyrimidine kinase, partial [Thermodesulfatator atlanticus]|nr:bifunctional hydroxymethylpyrimidine kinase/phosphomethylpyrimidine kinase [Thermodesulfatator atlanticus]